MLTMFNFFSSLTSSQRDTHVLESDNPVALVEQSRLTPTQRDLLLKQAELIATADSGFKQQQVLARMGFQERHITHMLAVLAEAQAQDVALTAFPTLQAVVDEMSERLHLFEIINMHRQNTDPDVLLDVSRCLKEETLQAALWELDDLADVLGYRLEQKTEQGKTLAAHTQTYDKTPGSIIEGMMAYHSFEHSDVRNDLYNQYKDGVPHNGVTYTSGVWGAAAQFDGETGRIQLDHKLLDGLKEFSVSFWIEATGEDEKTPNFISAANTEHDNELTFGLNALPSKFYLAFREQPIYFPTLASRVNMLDGNWHHIVLMKTTGSFSAYIDVEKDFEVDGFGDAMLHVAENGLWFGADQDVVGGGWQGWQESYRGKLDEVLFFNRTLAMDEILYLFNLPKFSYPPDWISDNRFPAPTTLPEESTDCDRECIEGWVNIAAGTLAVLGSIGAGVAACGFFKCGPYRKADADTDEPQNKHSFQPLG